MPDAADGEPAEGIERSTHEAYSSTPAPTTKRLHAELAAHMNKNDQADTLIEACLAAGPRTEGEVATTLHHVGLHAGHAAKRLKTGAAASSTSPRGRRGPEKR